MPRFLKRAISSCLAGLPKRTMATAVPLPPQPETHPNAVASTSKDVAPAEPSKWTPFTQRTGLLAKKRGMTALYDQNGTRWPVTVLQVDSCHVIRHEPPKGPEGKYTMQLGACDRKSKRVGKSVVNHFAQAGVVPKYHLKSFHVTEDALIPVGTELSAAHFVPGQYVDVVAKTIGKGFQGVMKRHGFRGAPATHGTTKVHRHGGSIGQNQSPGKVWKGKKMPGRMGGKQRTTQNLLVHRIDRELNLVFVRGAVPGFDDAVVSIKDAVRKVKWKAEDEFKRGKPDEEWLPQGVTTLPLPTVTVEQANAASWPAVVEWAGEGRS